MFYKLDGDLCIRLTESMPFKTHTADAKDTEDEAKAECWWLRTHPPFGDLISATGSFMALASLAGLA